MVLTLQINPDIALDQIIRNRYQRVITALQEKEFTYLCSYGEAQFPFSLLLLTPIYLMMRNQQEIIRITSPLRVTGYYPLLALRESGIIALVNGLNTKYYTQFTDGTLIISVNTQTKTILDPAGKVYKASFPGSEIAALEKHQQWIEGFIREGKQLNLSAGFEDYCAMSVRESPKPFQDIFGLLIVWIMMLSGIIWMIVKAWAWLSDLLQQLAGR